MSCSVLIELKGSLFNEVLKVVKPLHVQSLILVKGHALNEGSKVLIDTESLEILSHSGLDSLVKSGVVGTTVLLHLSVESVSGLVCREVFRHLHIVVVDLGVHGGGFDDKTLLGAFFADVNSEVAVVLREALFFFGDVLAFGVLILGERLSKRG